MTKLKGNDKYAIKKLTDKDIKKHMRHQEFDSIEDMKNEWSSMDVSDSKILSVLGNKWRLLDIDGKATAYAWAFYTNELSNDSHILIENEGEWYMISEEPYAIKNPEEYKSICYGNTEWLKKNPKHYKEWKNIKRVYEKYEPDYFVKHN